MQYPWFYLLIINAISFVLMLVDKDNSKRNRQRICELTFFIYAVLGGSYGIFLGMTLCRHKTKHLSFILGIPLIMFAQAVLVLLLWR